MGRYAVETITLGENALSRRQHCRHEPSARMQKFATELVALAPDVILAPGSSSTGPLLQATRTIPIVFATIADPVAAGFVESLSRPGGNVTGFSSYDYSIGGKWLQLLKEISPSLTRVAVIRDPTTPAGIAQLATVQAVAPSLGVELVLIYATLMNSGVRLQLSRALPVHC